MTSKSPIRPRSASKDVSSILSSISATGKKNQCSVALALAELTPAAREAFDIALRGDPTEYTHRGITVKLEELSGVKVGRDAVGKHRSSLLGGDRRCACVSN